MIPQRKSLAILPRIIRLYKLLSYVLFAIATVVTVIYLYPLFRHLLAGRFDLLPESLNLVFRPLVSWGLAGLGMYTFALVLELLVSIERSTRATANYLEWQMGEKERQR